MLAIFFALFTTVGWATSELALQHGHTAIVAPIAGSYPVLFVLLSSLIFRDPISRSQRLGMTVTLTGIVALSIISA